MCLALFSFAGCTFGGRDDVNIEEGDDFDIEEENPADVDPMVLDGVKVLTRPENYDFDDAIGEYSENYFNIYSSYLLNYLYNVYNQLNSKMGTEEIENFFAGAETGLTKSLI